MSYSIKPSLCCMISLSRVTCSLCPLTILIDQVDFPEKVEASHNRKGGSPDISANLALAMRVQVETSGFLSRQGILLCPPKALCVRGNGVSFRWHNGQPSLSRKLYETLRYSSTSAFLHYSACFSLCAQYFKHKTTGGALFPLRRQDYSIQSVSHALHVIYDMISETIVVTHSMA